jgi:hypothetical protein
LARRALTQGTTARHGPGAQRLLAAPSAILPGVAVNGREQAGVLGNLPRSRPGRRSTKREGGGGARRASDDASTPRAAAAAQRAKPADGPTAARTGGGRRRTSGASPQRSAPRQRPPTARRSSRSDPIGSAVRLAGKVAGAAVRTALGVLKKLPGA